MENYDLPTPPLTRPPSVEHNEDEVANGTETFTVLQQNVAQGQEEQQRTEGHWRLPNLTTAVMLAVQFLVGPLRVRARQGCRNDESGDDESTTPRSSLWEKTKAFARKVLDKAKDKINDVGEQFRGLSDDPIARTTRLLALAKAFMVRDMPRKAGHKRHDSDELFACDRNRLGADEAVVDGVKQICSQVAREFPEVGYNQVSGARTKNWMRLLHLTSSSVTKAVKPPTDNIRSFVIEFSAASEGP